MANPTTAEPLKADKPTAGGTGPASGAAASTRHFWRDAIGWAVVGVGAGFICAYWPTVLPGPPDLTTDTITHVNVLRPDAPPGTWVRIGDPKRVKRVKRIVETVRERGRPFQRERQRDIVGFIFLKLTSGREFTCTLFMDRHLQMSDLEIPLESGEYDFLRSLLDWAKGRSASGQAHRH